MTCDEVRERLSAFLDEALAPEERRRVEAHLASCADCARELERLRQTVALLRRVEPARAPIGFVDRVVAAARPRPWYRRAAAALFLPLATKLPTEAVALAMMGLLAVYIFERAPDVHRAAQPQAPAGLAADRELGSAPARAPGGAGSTQAAGAPAPQPDRDSLRRDPSRERRAATPAMDAKLPETAPPAASAPVPSAESTSASPTPPASVAAPAAPAVPPATPTAPAPQAAPTPPAAPGQPAAKSAAENIAGARARSATGNLRQAEESDVRLAAPSPQLATKQAAPASQDVIASAVMKDRDVAQRELVDLIARVGGTEKQQRREGEDTVVEVVVPALRLGEFAEGLIQIGGWRIEDQRPELPTRVLMRLRLK